ncbi:MAG: SUMF1/EgtB/PvdO family nonheme iron enzyme, partial [Gammaproteobacteria bacterium]|nr:SUMF1/EgtB/PvdO family nonheme iron enzyme [Gammaproteobacteria bacterium]
MRELLVAHGDNDEIVELTTLGLNHEQQHQELLLTDIKHVFSCNPLKPAALLSLASPPQGSVPGYSFTKGKSGIQRIGATGGGFCFDNETPGHDALLHEHQIGNRLVTNGEYRAFIEDGAYTKSELWLSDGWAVIKERKWRRPLYWDEALETEFTLGGVREIVEDAPVC